MYHTSLLAENRRFAHNPVLTQTVRLTAADFLESGGLLFDLTGVVSH